MRIQSLQRAIEILNLFKNVRGPLGITEMATSLNLAKTTVHGLVSTLEQNGFLKKDIATRKYRLGFALFELGAIQMSRLEINQHAASPLQTLANKINRTCRVAILDRDSIIVTMTVQPQGHKSTHRQFGPRLPGYCTALGKAILANLPALDVKSYLDATPLKAYTPHTIVDRRRLEQDFLKTKERGYSISREEVLLHQVGLGAPVFTMDGAIAGAVSARLETGELDTEKMAVTADLLMQTAHHISLEMGYQPMDIAYSFV